MNKNMITSVTDESNWSSFLKTIERLVFGAYLLPSGTKYKYKGYDSYITEALRLINYFFIDSQTKMNPN